MLTIIIVLNILISEANTFVHFLHLNKCLTKEIKYRSGFISKIHSELCANDLNNFIYHLKPKEHHFHINRKNCVMN